MESLYGIFEDRKVALDVFPTNEYEGLQWISGFRSRSKNIKFMQRSNAANGDSPKRRKVERISPEPVIIPDTKSQSPKTFVQDQEARRESALRLLAEEAGETHWQLSTLKETTIAKGKFLIKPMVSNESTPSSGRRHFIGPNRKSAEVGFTIPLRK